MVVQTEPENEAAIEELFKLTEKNILTPRGSPTTAGW